VDNKLVAIAERTPAHVIGDGESTVQQLIDTVNQDSRRGYGHEKVLTQIDVDQSTEKLLKSEKLYARNRSAEG
jgi:cyanophycin synthetase